MLRQKQGCPRKQSRTPSHSSEVSKPRQSRVSNHMFKTCRDGTKLLEKEVEKGTWEGTYGKKSTYSVSLCKSTVYLFHGKNFTNKDTHMCFASKYVLPWDVVLRGFGTSMSQPLPLVRRSKQAVQYVCNTPGLAQGFCARPHLPLNCALRMNRKEEVNVGS